MSILNNVVINSRRKVVNLFIHGKLSPLFISLALTLIGLVALKSASEGMGIDFFSRQLLFLTLAVPAFFIVVIVGCSTILRYAIVFYWVTLLALVGVLIFGYVAGGAKSWFYLGPIRIQPSEFAKIAIICTLARFLGSRGEKKTLTLKDILGAAIIVVIPAVLVILQPDLGTAMMILSILPSFLLVGGVRWYLVVLSLILCIVLSFFIWDFVLKDYQKERIYTFFNPEKDPLGAGYQIRQSKIAIGSGKIFGRGFKQGTQSRLRFLPARHTDFIFAVFAEEWGFLGVTIAIFLFGYLLNSLITLMENIYNTENLYIVTGVAALLFIHLFYNIAMVVGLLPVSGIPLPFFSYGGSFLLTCYILIGLVVSVSLEEYGFSPPY